MHEGSRVLSRVLSGLHEVLRIYLLLASIATLWQLQWIKGYYNYRELIIKFSSRNRRRLNFRLSDATCWRFTQLRGADLIMTVIMLQLHSIYNVVHGTF